MINRNKFYRDLERYREQRQLDKSPRQKKIQDLQSELMTARNHWRVTIKKLKQAEKRIKELEDKIKLLKYDNTDLKNDLEIVRKNYAYEKKLMMKHKG